jgi:hypothetical protein
MKTTRTFNTTLDCGDKIQLTITFDLGADTDIIAQWATSERVIAFQRPLKKLSLEEARALNNTTVDAASCGRKIESPEARVKSLALATGLDPKIIRLMMNDPDLVRSLVQPSTDFETA